MRPYRLGIPKRERIDRPRSPLILLQDPALQIHPFKGGGPIQRLFVEAFTTIRGKFIQELSKLQMEGQHAEPGTTFQIYKRIAIDSKIHRITTDKRLINYKCDMADYVQLIYGACFQMLWNWRQESIDNAAFVVFTLYFVFQTNGLERPPTDPTDADAILRTLQLGLSGNRYRMVGDQQMRRHYRRKIRIDRNNYAILRAIRDTALARKAARHAKESLDEHQRTCFTSVDLIHVLDRLWDSFDYVEYTGPMSVEGLAGHEDYPYPESRSAFLERRKALTTKETPPAPEPEVVQRKFTFDSDIERRIQEYEDAKKEIRLPPHNTKSRKEKAVRDYVTPLFADRATKALAHALRTGEIQSDRLNIFTRRVTFANIETIGDTIALQEVEDMDVATNAPSIEVETKELVLPPNLSAALRRSLQNGLQTLLDRDPAVFDKQTEQKSVVSSTSKVSARTSASKVGRRALETLLSATNNGRNSDFLGISTSDWEPSNHRKKDIDSDDMSDLSGDESEVEEGSRVGKSALEGLLSTTYDDGISLATGSRSDRRSKRRRQNPGVRSSKKSIQEPSSDSESSWSSQVSEDSFDTQILQGRQALSRLLG